MDPKEKKREWHPGMYQWFGLTNGLADKKNSHHGKRALRYFNNAIQGKATRPNDRTTYKQEVAKSVADVVRFWILIQEFRGKEHERPEYQWIFPAEYMTLLAKYLATWMPVDYTMAVIHELGEGLNEQYAIKGEDVKVRTSVNMEYKWPTPSVHDHNAMREYKQWKVETKRSGSIFILPSNQKKYFRDGLVGDELKAIFAEKEYPLNIGAHIKRIKEEQGKWTIVDGSILYIVKEEEGELLIYRKPGWGRPRK